MEKILRYFMDEKKVTQVVAEVLQKKLSKYQDIEREFIYWIEYRNFEAPNALEIEGYTAQKIHEIAPSLDAAGIYNFMVTLRDNPEKAQKYIKHNFPRK